MMKCQEPRAGAAFTLIEVLVVVAVTSILIALTIPALRAAREAGRTSRCLANVRQIGLVTHIIVTDENDIFPFWMSNTPPSPPVGRLAITDVYLGQINSLENFRCPSDPSKGDEAEGYTSYTYWPGEYIAMLLPDYQTTQAAVAAVSRLFFDTPNATVFLDRQKWHSGGTRQAVFMPDWHAGPTH